MLTNEQACKVSFEESGHVALVHERGYHDDDYDAGVSCMFCEGGLFACIKCGSFEGMTTTHCPGYGLDVMGNVGNAVYAGQLDFRDGEWVPVGSPHTPHRGWEMKVEWFQ